MYYSYWASDHILIDPKRKVLITGSVPTENLPVRSHEVPKRESRRVLVRPDVEQNPSRPSSSKQQGESQRLPTMENLLLKLQIDETVGNWKAHKVNDDEVRIELQDEIHSIPKYIVCVNSGFEFTVFVFNWPNP